MEPLTAIDDYETWTNLTQSRHAIKRFSARGDLMDELIAGNKNFHVTTRERHINEERAADADLDPFSNGTFSPVHLIDTTDDADEIASNPALITETEMASLVKANVKVLEKRVKEVRNPVVLERLLEVANQSDATVGRVAVIKDRLNEVAPSLFTEIASSAPRPDESTKPAPR